MPRRVLSESGEIFSTDTSLRRIAAHDGDLLGLTGAAASVAEKAALRARTGAVAIDLESHIVAAAAARAKKPFMVLRAVADPAGFALPPAALVGHDAAGRAALGAVMLSLLRHPRQLPALLRLARDYRAALKSLARAAEAF